MTNRSEPKLTPPDSSDMGEEIRRTYRCWTVAILLTLIAILVVALVVSWFSQPVQPLQGGIYSNIVKSL